MEKTDRTTLSLKSPDLHVPAVTIGAGSMSEAAQQKQTSQSAISRLIASLEHVLGFALLERTPRGIGRALIVIHDRSRHADRKTDAKRNYPRQPSPGRREVIQMAATITLTYPFSAEDTALLNKLLGNSGGAATGGAITGATGAPTGGRAAVGAAITPAQEYFPDDPGIAKFPSPENSQILVFNGKISGRPYLKDQAGAIHQIKKDAAGIPQYFKNDQLVRGQSRRGGRPVPGKAG